MSGMHQLETKGGGKQFQKAFARSYHRKNVENDGEREKKNEKECVCACAHEGQNVRVFTDIP